MAEHLSRSLRLIPLALVLACGGGEQGTTGNGSGPVQTGGGSQGTDGPTEEQPPDSATICADVIGLQCQGHASCCDQEADQYASVEECRSVLEPLCATDLAGVAYGDGRIAFDFDAYRSALESARAAIGSCEPFPLGIWDPIFSGTGAVGVDCTPADDGMDYSPMLACEDGLGCVGGEESEERACTALAQDGEACTDVECAPGLYCHSARRGRATCRAREDEGARCSANEDCATGYCGDAGRCAARTASVSYCGDLSYP